MNYALLDDDHKLIHLYKDVKDIKDIYNQPPRFSNGYSHLIRINENILTPVAKWIPLILDTKLWEYEGNSPFMVRRDNINDPQVYKVFSKGTIHGSWIAPDKEVYTMDLGSGTSWKMVSDNPDNLQTVFFQNARLNP